MNDGDKIITLPTYSRGRRRIYIHLGQGGFVAARISPRIIMNMDGAFTLLVCTSLPNIKNTFNGAFLMYRVKGSVRWTFAITASVHFNLDTQPEGKIILFSWTGTTNNNGSPTFFDSTNWEEASQHFEQKEYSSNKIEMEFGVWE